MLSWRGQQMPRPSPSISQGGLGPELCQSCIVVHVENDSVSRLRFVAPSAEMPIGELLTRPKSIQFDCGPV
jgi:hypothetical protein